MLKPGDTFNGWVLLGPDDVFKPNDEITACAYGAFKKDDDDYNDKILGLPSQGKGGWITVPERMGSSVANWIRESRNRLARRKLTPGEKALLSLK